MALLTREIEALVGMESEEVAACDRVERGAVRRFAQASLDDDPIYYEASAASERFGGPVAPPLFPMTMFRDDFGSADVLSERAADPDFDGIVGATVQGLPPLPVSGLALLNGGTEVELFAYAPHGSRVTSKSRYEAIYEKSGKSGPMLFVVIATDYMAEGRLLLRVRKTQIRR
ncbi:MAG TPA: MaoC family dehydratase N-terminal domain-containing protein [Pseudolabrys sp.]|nr:MaoC family dehydratase N-terminal domain-containing protein [Pseudolabrys sp.]